MYLFFFFFLFQIYFSSSYYVHDDDDINDGADNNGKDMKNVPRLPTWLLESTPDDFVVRTINTIEAPMLNLKMSSLHFYEITLGFLFNFRKQ